jgi:hypothetical protein
VAELQAWGFIEEAEVVDPTWIEVAYTWSWPGSRWKPEALRRLQEADIFQVGRYGRWIFQGIADSIRDGFYAGSSMREFAAAGLTPTTNGTHQEVTRWQGDKVAG